jgi:hypothetical protein
VSKAARSVFLFGVYVVVLGMTLVVAPNPLLRLFGVAETYEVWIHVLGVLIFNIGVFYVLAGLNEIRPIVLASIPIRFGTMTLLVLFVLLGDAENALILFGLVDVACALWTIAALRADARAMSDAA